MSARREEKSIGPIEWKAAATGEFAAVFATLNVVDHDGDVTLPGAFKDGSDVIVGSWGHKTNEPPIGRGTIRVTPSEALVEGKLFLDTPQGEAAHTTLRNLGPLAQWSYVFAIAKQRFGQHEGRPVRFLEALNVYSVDPVLAGAGIDTRTVAVKCDACETKQGVSGDSATIIRREAEWFEAFKGKLALQAAVRESQELLMRFKEAPTEFETSPSIISFEQREAATAAARKAAELLGLKVVPPVRFFLHLPAAKERLWGHASRGGSEIWLRADLSPAALAWVACHEVKHLTQPPDMASAAAEDDANRFAVAVTGRPMPSSKQGEQA